MKLMLPRVTDIDNLVHNVRTEKQNLFWIVHPATSNLTRQSNTR